MDDQEDIGTLTETSGPFEKSLRTDIIYSRYCNNRRALRVTSSLDFFPAIGAKPFPGLSPRQGRQNSTSASETSLFQKSRPISGCHAETYLSRGIFLKLIDGHNDAIPGQVLTSSRWENCLQPKRIQRFCAQESLDRPIRIQEFTLSSARFCFG